MLQLELPNSAWWHTMILRILRRIVRVVHPPPNKAGRALHNQNLWNISHSQAKNSETYKVAKLDTLTHQDDQ